MPNPQVGLGADVSGGLQRYKWALYLADFGGAAVVPTNKLGAASEPAAPWVRQGRLRFDDIAWENTDIEFLKGRAGFQRSVKYNVPRQAEDIGLRIRLDESDPDVQAMLRGDANATALSNGSNTGTEFIYKTGEYYNAKVLLVGVEVQGIKERHIYLGNCVVTFKPVHEDEYEGVDVVIAAADVDSTETFKDRIWD